MKKNMYCSLLVVIAHLLLIIPLNAEQTVRIPQYYCTATDAKYFTHLLNLIGSIHRYFDDIEEIAVFDLGMTQEQRDQLGKIEKVTLHDIEKVHPDIIKPIQTTTWGKVVPGWYAWKIVAIKQMLDRVPYVLWIDAGSTVCKSLNDLFAYIKEHGYFLSTIGMDPLVHNVEWGTVRYVREKFKLDDPENQWILKEESIMGGICGMSRNHPCYAMFVQPIYEMAHDLKNFEDDGSALHGFGCGRNDQTLFSIIGYKNRMKVFRQDETQKEPMKLLVNGQEKDFYITWEAPYVCDKTNIFSSRHYLYNYAHYTSFTQYK